MSINNRFLSVFTCKLFLRAYPSLSFGDNYFLFYFYRDNFSFNFVLIIGTDSNWKEYSTVNFKIGFIILCPFFVGSGYLVLSHTKLHHYFFGYFTFIQKGITVIGSCN